MPKSTPKSDPSKSDPLKPEPSKSELAKALAHDIWPAERIGDLLVVTPVGDPIGFQSASFNSEYSRIQTIAASPGVRNVLVDLSRSRYFGSEMIGTLVRLRRVVAESHGDHPGGSQPQTAEAPLTDASAPRPAGAESEAAATGGDIARGGVMALCGVSQDMQAGLSVMNVDQLWLTFPDRRTAVAKMAHVPAGERASRLLQRVRLPAALLVAAAVVAMLFVPAVREGMFRPTAASDLASVRAMELRLQRKLNTKLTEEDLRRAGLELTQDFAWIQRRKESKGLSVAHMQVLTAADRLMRWMGNPSDTRLEAAYRESLARASAMVETEMRQGPEPAAGRRAAQHAAAPADGPAIETDDAEPDGR